MAGVVLGGLQAGHTAEAEGTVEPFLDALAVGEGPKTCAKLTSAAKAELVDVAGAPAGATCAEVVRGAEPFTGEDAADAPEDADATVQLNGDLAIAEVSGLRSDPDLIKADGEWLISGGFES